MIQLIVNTYLWYLPLLLFFEIALNKKKSNTTALASDNGEKVTGKQDEPKAGLLYSILVFLPLILIAGYRAGIHGGIGDTGLYCAMFRSYPNTLSELMNSSDVGGKMYGWEVFSVFIKQFISQQDRYWLLTIAIIQGVCLLLTFRRYSTDIAIIGFLFFASTDFISWMMNGMRQFLVVSVIFLLFPLVQKRKVWSIGLFVFSVIILSKIHSSCLLVIPLYLVSLGKPFNKSTIFVLICCVLSVVFLGQFTDILGSALETTDYSGVTTYMQTDDGTNPLRVIVYSIPAIFAIIFRKKLFDDAPDIINISVNMSLISMGIYVVSIFTSGIFIGRIPIYFSLFSYILLPWELRKIFPKEKFTIVLTIMVVLYMIFYFIQVKQWGFW